MGGFGSAVLEYAADQGHMIPIKRLGIPDEVIEQGEQIELQRECGFDPQGIIDTVRQLSNQEKSTGSTPETTLA